MISFAGDALICVFPANLYQQSTSPEDSMKEVCQRAVMCAKDLADTPSPDLTIHVAVSCGMVRFATIGGYHNHWIYLMNGSCINDLSTCKLLYDIRNLCIVLYGYYICRY